VAVAKIIELLEYMLDAGDSGRVVVGQPLHCSELGENLRLLETVAQVNSGCSGGSDCTPAPMSTPTPPPWTASISQPRAAAWRPVRPVPAQRTGPGGATDARPDREHALAPYRSGQRPLTNHPLVDLFRRNCMSLQAERHRLLGAVSDPAVSQTPALTWH
jgi:hypothetical protein